MFSLSTSKLAIGLLLAQTTFFSHGTLAARSRDVISKEIKDVGDSFWNKIQPLMENLHEGQRILDRYGFKTTFAEPTKRMYPVGPFVFPGVVKKFEEDNEKLYNLAVSVSGGKLKGVHDNLRIAGLEEMLKEKRQIAKLANEVEVAGYHDLSKEAQKAKEAIDESLAELSAFRDKTETPFAFIDALKSWHSIIPFNVRGEIKRRLELPRDQQTNEHWISWADDLIKTGDLSSPAKQESWNDAKEGNPNTPEHLNQLFAFKEFIEFKNVLRAGISKENDRLRTKPKAPRPAHDDTDAADNRLNALNWYGNTKGSTWAKYSEFPIQVFLNSYNSALYPDGKDYILYDLLKVGVKELDEIEKEASK